MKYKSKRGKLDWRDSNQKEKMTDRMDTMYRISANVTERNASGNMKGL